MSDTITASIPAVIDAANLAADILRDSEWDWNQDFADAAGERHVISGADEIDSLPDETSRAAAREYAEWTVGQFDEAVEELEHAIRMMEECYEGWESDARFALCNAIRAEAAMGYANETGELAEALERALEADDE